MRKAVVTLAIGEKYERMFEDYCKDNWQQYCDRFGYELIVITEPLDSSARANLRSPAWQKLLILSQDWSAEYDRVVWIDTDIVINNAYASDICEGVPIDKVGAVEAYSIPSREIHDITLERMYRYWDRENIKYLDNRTPKSYYTNRGLPENSLKEVVHTGVFVCSPKYHREIFEYVYNNYEDARGAEWNYEMPMLSFELVKANLVHWISPRFNFAVLYVAAAYYPDDLLGFEKPQNKAETSARSRSLLEKILHMAREQKPINILEEREVKCLKNIYELSVFMHFAGCTHLIQKSTSFISSGNNSINSINHKPVMCAVSRV
ncbi:hypothetical protein ACFSRY_17305 [Pontibacter locisalis]|uniref:Glycosyl transferase family 8 n=1 Tax=Pontibacter locisalis TaxID=1719035 RepID=A0ABW5ISH9_9BACT